MALVWILAVSVWTVAGGFVLIAAISRATAAPRARGVPVAVRFTEARRLVARPAQFAAPARRPCEHPPQTPRRDPRRNQPRSRVAYCDGRVALRQRHAPRS